MDAASSHTEKLDGNCFICHQMPEHSLLCPCALLQVRDNSVLCPSVSNVGVAQLPPSYHPGGAGMMMTSATSDTNHYLILFCLMVVWRSWLVLLGVKPGLWLLCVTHGISKAEVELTGTPVWGTCGLLDAQEGYFTLYSDTDHLCISHNPDWRFLQNKN